ncbi:hypothetical protein QAD02_017957 [Eretmocerus hayati]|uniref:Uncharacterized protein n=1 Tax=Eretmocerus hayati TaxID=131215 RepID=A0ACC2PF11_9HYME|nr:hypothetical protein QAD02_017957 [Eretmocerus hayati]
MAQRQRVPPQMNSNEEARDRELELLRQQIAAGEARQAATRQALEQQLLEVQAERDQLRRAEARRSSSGSERGGNHSLHTASSSVPADPSVAALMQQVAVLQEAVARLSNSTVRLPSQSPMLQGPAATPTASLNGSEPQQMVTEQPVLADFVPGLSTGAQCSPSATTRDMREFPGTEGRWLSECRKLSECRQLSECSRGR